jgi:hypothetical protein
MPKHTGIGNTSSPCAHVQKHLSISSAMLINTCIAAACTPYLCMQPREGDLSSCCIVFLGNVLHSVHQLNVLQEAGKCCLKWAQRLLRRENAMSCNTTVL